MIGGPWLPFGRAGGGQIFIQGPIYFPWGGRGPIFYDFFLTYKNQTDRRPTNRYVFVYCFDKKIRHRASRVRRS